MTTVGGRVDGETEKAFGAFVVFRDLGPDRTLDAVARKLGKTRQWFGQLSIAHNWPERAAAWDDELDRARRETVIETTKDLAEENARRLQEMGEAAQRAALAYLNDRLTKDGALNANAVVWRDFQAIARVAIDALQLAQNRPTSIQGSAITAEQLDKILSSLPDDERAKVVAGLRILQKAASE